MGVEWSGDWCDDDEKWTVSAKNNLEYEPNQQKSDGVFWMNALDFLQNFKILYLCRQLSNKNGWHKAERSGEWKGASACGPPTRNGSMQSAPQYSITVSKPCFCFV